MSDNHDNKQSLSKVFESNRNWANGQKKADPEFFQNHAEQQSPEYLWIGCADSRVPVNDILGLGVGEVFVHRNIANVVAPNDTNCLSVLQYAVQVLKVRHVLVCGHYGCGGVKAADGDAELGLIDNWLAHIKQVKAKHLGELNGLEEHARVQRLCELNVIEQVNNVANTTIVADAWAAGQALTIHGLIYGLEDGLLKDLDVQRSTPI